MEMKRLGFGMMRMPLLDPDNEASVDVEKVKEMVDLFMSRGFTYFDTAIMYNGAVSQKVAGEALVSRYPRDSFQLATKLHHNYIHAPEDPDRIFNEQLEQTGAGYFDYYLIHGVNEGSFEKYEKYDCFNWLLEKKARGLVKHAGFSFHDGPEMLERILTAHPEMEFVQMQLNYLDWDSDCIRAREVYETAVRHGKPVIVMEPVKGGSLAKLPEEAEKLLKEAEPERSPASWAIRFAASRENVMMVLSGMSSPEQMEDNLRTMEDFRPLTEEEEELLRKAAEIIRSRIAVACTGCSYCTGGCPVSIPIPRYFALYNEEMRDPDKGWTANFVNYENLARHFGKASDCLACGQCEGVCPQQLPIIELMQKVAEFFEK